MSRRPISDEARTYTEFRNRAQQLMALANIVQNEDPERAWRQIERLSDVERQQMLKAALMVVPTHLGVEEAFSWVMQLPVAREVSV